MNTTANTEKVLTIQEVAASFSIDLPDWQRRVNLNWLTTMHALMSEGGIWGSPNLGTVYRKSGDGFVFVESIPGAETGGPGKEAPTIAFNAAKRARLRVAYDLAFAENEFEFEFEGDTLRTDYAKYLLEYLDGLQL